MADSWWVVTYTAQGTGAAQLGTVIVQAPSRSAARTAAAQLLPSTDTVGAARGPYPSQAAAAAGGVATGGPGTGGPVSGQPGAAPPGTKPPSGGGQVTATPSNLGSSSPCLISAPKVNLVITSVGGGCVFSKTNARALVGGLILGASGILAIVGLSLLVVEGFQSSGAGEMAGRSLETVGAGLAFVPGLEPAGLAVGGAGMAARRAGSRSGASQSLGRRTAAREQAARDAAAQQRKAAASQAGATP